MRMQLIGTHDVWRCMVYDYQIHFAVACQIIKYLQEGYSQEEIEALIPKPDAYNYARYTFNNRIQYEEVG